MKRGTALFIIVLALVAWASALVFWIMFWLNLTQRMNDLAAQLPPSVRSGESSAVSLVVGIILLMILLAGVNGLIVWVARQYSLNKMTRDFVSMVSHDLRSPLATIKLYLETMQLRELSDEKRDQFLTIMLSEVGRLSTLIETILDVSRMERRRFAVNLRWVDLSELVRKFYEDNCQIVHDRDRQLILERTERTVIAGDEEALEKCLDNLVSNAVRYSRSGGRIWLSVRRVRNYGCIAVRDEGAGFTRRENRKLFQRFYRGAAGKKMNKVGSGLGLYIVREIVRLHRGKVKAGSRGAGKGAVFYLLLPALKGQNGGPDYDDEHPETAAD